MTSMAVFALALAAINVGGTAASSPDATFSWLAVTQTVIAGLLLAILGGGFKVYNSLKDLLAEFKQQIALIELRITRVEEHLGFSGERRTHRRYNVPRGTSQGTDTDD